MINSSAPHNNLGSQTNNVSLTMSYNTPRGFIDSIIDPYFPDKRHFNNEIINFQSELTYQVANQSGGHKHELNVKKVNIDSKEAAKWTQMGYSRYNTVIVRYIEWFVHLQRVMRLLMRDQLSWVNDPIVHKSNAINQATTEFYSNDKFEISDFE